jgi:hypothetical protein
VLEPALDDAIPRLGSKIDPMRALRVVKQLCVEVERLHPALGEIGASLPGDLMAEISKMFAVAEEALRQPGRPTGPYR